VYQVGINKGIKKSVCIQVTEKKI